MSIICPVPKRPNPFELNDFRPVALTPIIMKCFDRIMLHHLLKQTDGKLDPLQFAYKRNRGAEDAILSLLHHTYTHLDKVGSFVRILFVDYSSTFNTTQPHLLTEKLFSLNVRPKLIVWLIDFLVNRSQVVRYQNVPPQVKTTSTGAPQGTVLSPVFFTIYIPTISGAVAPRAACTSIRMTLPWQICQIQTFILSSMSLK